MFITGQKQLSMVCPTLFAASDRHGYGIPGGYMDTGTTGTGTDRLFSTQAVPVPISPKPVPTRAGIVCKNTTYSDHHG